MYVWGLINKWCLNLQNNISKAEDLTKLSKPTNSNVRQEREEGTILNKTTIEGSNTQIIVKQENNDIVIRIEQDKSPANQSMWGTKCFLNIINEKLDLCNCQ